MTPPRRISQNVGDEIETKIMLLQMMFTLSQCFNTACYTIACRLLVTWTDFVPTLYFSQFLNSLGIVSTESQKS